MGRGDRAPVLPHLGSPFPRTNGNELMTNRNNTNTEIENILVDTDRNREWRAGGAVCTKSRLRSIAKI